MIGENADRLGTPRLKIVAGEAPQALPAKTRPMRCSSAAAWAFRVFSRKAGRRSSRSGRMVANVVTLEGELHLVDLQEKHGGDLVRLDVSYLTRIGPLRALKPRMAVLQWRAVKP